MALRAVIRIELLMQRAVIHASQVLSYVLINLGGVLRKVRTSAKESAECHLWVEAVGKDRLDYCRLRAVQKKQLVRVAIERFEALFAFDEPPHRDLMSWRTSVRVR